MDCSEKSTISKLSFGSFYMNPCKCNRNLKYRLHSAPTLAAVAEAIPGGCGDTGNNHAHNSFANIWTLYFCQAQRVCSGVFTIIEYSRGKYTEFNVPTDRMV